MCIIQQSLQGNHQKVTDCIYYRMCIHRKASQSSRMYLSSCGHCNEPSQSCRIFIPSYCHYKKNRIKVAAYIYIYIYPSMVITGMQSLSWRMYLTSYGHCKKIVSKFRNIYNHRRVITRKSSQGCKVYISWNGH